MKDRGIPSRYGCSRRERECGLTDEKSAASYLELVTAYSVGIQNSWLEIKPGNTHGQGGVLRQISPCRFWVMSNSKTVVLIELNGVIISRRNRFFVVDVPEVNNGFLKGRL